MPTPEEARIEITKGVCGGKPRIAGHRITVQNVAIWHERLRWSCEEIAAEYGLDFADIYVALTYYYDHREEIERSIQEDKDFVEMMRQTQTSPLQEKLRGLKNP